MNECLSVFLKQILPEDVLTGKIQYNEISQSDFKQMMFVYMNRYSGVELENLYSYLTGLMKAESLNIFHLLFLESEDLLMIQNNKLCCRYERFMRWRMDVLALGQEIFTTAYLASHASREDVRKLGFSWRFVLGHDNYQLNRLLRDGLSENHFHLYGSAPVFPASWIALMNDPFKLDYTNMLAQIGGKKRFYHVSYSTDYKEPSLIRNCQLAALIRVYLYSRLTWEYGQEKDKGIQPKSIWHIVKEPEQIGEYGYEIQDGIEFLRNGQELDYAAGHLKRDEDKAFFYAGERWLMYEIFHALYTEKFQDGPEIGNLFYAYLLLKNRLYEELVLSNEQIGFDNFQIYQARKSHFINDKLKKESIQQAVYDLRVSGRLKTLEIRISPNKSVWKDAKQIVELDRLIDPENVQRENYFYVFHFLKSTDKSLENNWGCRHRKLRTKIERQAKVLANFRRDYPEIACRVRGIDAAGQEIGCRPEVFATVFRYLKNDIGEECFEIRVPQLRCTYHVGEDFLDILDGLRAIEEAICFLNLQCGDRIGHALALGLNVETWYSRKNNYLILPAQDYLDNIVWMYEKMVEWDIPDQNNLKEWIEGEFTTYFNEIYKNNMHSEVIRTILKAYNDACGTSVESLSFDIHTYYKAWQLRGDDPELYSSGIYKKYSPWEDGYENRKWNRCYPKNGEIRKIPEVTILNYFYQYNRDVKGAGARVVMHKIEKKYCDMVSVLQKKMQFWTEMKGIAIETNPTSNFKISSIERFDEHPIFEFYNNGLTTVERKLKESPQLNVSINTDDQGVMATDLVNEYSVLAYALEHIKDENGQQMYSRENVLNWLERVKKMGNRQTFMED